MRVMVFEPISSGHRFAYLAHLLPEMCKLGLETVLVTSHEARRSAPFETHLSRYAEQFRVDDWFPLPRDHNNFQFADYFENSFKRVEPAHCFLPVGDGISQIIGARRWFGKRSAAEFVETEALHFRGRFGYPLPLGSATFKRFASRKSICNAPWYRWFHLDEVQLAALCRGNESLTNRSFVMPDPVEAPPQIDKAEARSLLGLPGRGRFVGCAGNINLRKGIGWLLKAFAQALPRLDANDRVLLAGPADDAMRNLMRKEYGDLVADGRLICIDRYLSVEEMAQSMIAMDLICTPYPEHSGSSSIVIRAAAVNRPLLAADVNWMGRTVKQLELGHALDVCNSESFADAIVARLQSSDSFELTEKARRFVKFHSGENFAATWLRRIREKLGLPPDDRFLPWQ